MNLINLYNIIRGKMFFQDRVEAGKLLGQKVLDDIGETKNGIVLALPRGGVVTGFEVAKKLNLPLDIIVTRKIGAPGNPEYAIGAVGEHSFVLNAREQVDKKYLEEQIKKERREIKRRLNQYRGEKLASKLQGKTVILADDGLATGQSMQAAIEEVKIQNPRQIIVAVPVAPPDTVNKLRTLTNQIIVLENEPMFFAVGQFYANFEQTTDEEVKVLLERSLQDS